MITEPLIIKGDCPYIVNGKEEVITNERKVVINYGEGTCDKFAIGHLENGKEFVIVLRPRF